VAGGAFGPRARITADGLNIWMGVSTPTYQRE
jgi:hypothetical protein